MDMEISAQMKAIYLLNVLRFQKLPTNTEEAYWPVPRGLTLSLQSAYHVFQLCYFALRCADMIGER